MPRYDRNRQPLAAHVVRDARRCAPAIAGDSRPSIGRRMHGIGAGQERRRG